MSQIDKQFILDMVNGYSSRGRHAPLTPWEEYQLMYAYLKSVGVEEIPRYNVVYEDPIPLL